ncbi:MAG: FLAP-like endonuclease XPG [Hyperionvirus sp.]|uniref:FLAP-like endonuclease XPG n=1 Tax=Hyperionvirus sp. TaxID=2487770 RepID=A0A3G5AG50_9VIRU|nr:MAG: FLAP-like endonuclease XPG [Hyperionvirus sp.]
MLYKLIYGIRGRGYDIMNGDIVVTHIHALLMKFVGFRRFGIVPVFVFDGGQPEIKFDALELRKENKEKLVEKYRDSKSEKGKRIYFYIKSDITGSEIDQCRELIDIFGFPNFDAKEEADGQLAQLYKRRVVDYIASDDMDILLFGGGILLKNFTVASTKKIQEINLREILRLAKISQQQLIEIGILLGTDYCDNTRSSPTKAFGLIEQYHDLHHIPFIGKKCDQAVQYFNDPPVKKITEISVGKLNKKKLIDFLKRYNFKEKYIKKILAMLK